MAAYSGHGTINGDGHYKFAVVVTDARAGEIPEDRFRIRIWNDATIALSGGNITIHK